MVIFCVNLSEFRCRNAKWNSKILKAERFFRGPFIIPRWESSETGMNDVYWLILPSYSIIGALLKRNNRISGTSKNWVNLNSNVGINAVLVDQSVSLWHTYEMFLGTLQVKLGSGVNRKYIFSWPVFNKIYFSPLEPYLFYWLLSKEVLDDWTWRVNV